MDGINKVKPVKTPLLKTVKRHWILASDASSAVFVCGDFFLYSYDGCCTGIQKYNYNGGIYFHPGMVSITLRH